MHPAGAYLVAQALHEERLRSAEQRRRPERPTDGRRLRLVGWSEILRFPRFRLADARG